MTINNFYVIKNLLTFDDKDDFYFLQIIQRKKDGNLVPSANNGYRTIKTYYIRSLEDFDRRKEAIIQLCKQNNARAYINLNVRNAREVALTAAKAYIDLVREDRCSQGHRIYDHVCGVTPKIGIKKKWIVDIDGLSSEDVETICNIICKCRSAYPMENPDADMYENIIARIPTAHGHHIITHGFDAKRFRDILEQTIKINLTKDQIIEITNVKKDNPTLLYFDNQSQPCDLLEVSWLQDIVKNQKDCPPEFMEAVHKNFWNLVDTKESECVSRGYLTDWYQQSIDETEPPIWTDKHLDELYNDFYLIPKNK